MPSGYMLTYGGFLLLGGRAADLLGRRRVLPSGPRFDNYLDSYLNPRYGSHQ